MKDVKKILFICKKRIDSYGISFGLLNSASFIANKFDLDDCSCDVETKVISVVDANAIDREVSLYKPTHVVIHALWITPAKLEELVRKWKSVHWIIRIHSKIPFLANEGIAFNWICHYKDIMAVRNNLVISGNSRSLNDDLRETLNVNSVYLPNIYCPEDYVMPVKEPKEKGLLSESIDIGCFGALRPMKNHMNQAVAAVKFAERMGKFVNFHINGDRIEQRGDEVLKNMRAFFGCLFGHRLIAHPWMEHKDFIGLVKTMDIGMQVSFSESFNIVSADFAWNDVPMVMGKDIDWAPCIFAADPNDTDDMVRKLKTAWYGRFIGLHNLSKHSLKKYNSKAYDIWADYICST